MAVTAEEFSELQSMMGLIAQHCNLLTAEGLVTPANRLITAGNITKLNDNLESLQDYMASIIPTVPL